MKILKSFVIALSLSGLALTFTSCRENKNEDVQEKMEMEQEEMEHEGMDHNGMDHEGMDHDGMEDDNAAVKPEFKNEDFAAVFQHYIHVKTALVNDDVAEAKKGGEMLTKALGEDRDQIQEYSEKITNSDEIEEQRKAFSELTNLLEPAMEGALKSGEIYKQYCPMAFNNTGAAWLSADKEIRNPYFGDKMLNCGTVKGVIQ